MLALVGTVPGGHVDPTATTHALSPGKKEFWSISPFWVTARSSPPVARDWRRSSTELSTALLEAKNAAAAERATATATATAAASTRRPRNVIGASGEGSRIS